MASEHEDEWHMGTWENEGGWVQDFDRSPGYLEFTPIEFDNFDNKPFVVPVSGTYELTGSWLGPIIHQFIEFPPQEMQAND